MKNNDQRDIIEQLLGITMLTQKAEKLKEQQKEIRDSIKEEEFKIKAIQEANERFEKSISDVERRQRLWLKKRDEDVAELQGEIDAMRRLDIEAEVAKHAELETWTANKSRYDEATRCVGATVLKADNTKQQKLIAQT